MLLVPAALLTCFTNPASLTTSSFPYIRKIDMHSGYMKWTHIYKEPIVRI
jgi:hypothetical protein